MDCAEGASFPARSGRRLLPGIGAIKSRPLYDTVPGSRIAKQGAARDTDRLQDVPSPLDQPLPATARSMGDASTIPPLAAWRGRVRRSREESQFVLRSRASRSVLPSGFRTRGILLRPIG